MLHLFISTQLFVLFIMFLIYFKLHSLTEWLVKLQQSTLGYLFVSFQ
jgi:hypothetical protein